MQLSVGNRPPARVVVTGMGAVTPFGLGVQTFWEAATAGRSAVRRLPQFVESEAPVKIGAPVPNFDPLAHFDTRDARRMARFTQFALVAVREAVAQSGLDTSRINPERVGVELGNAVGDLSTIETQHEVLRQQGPRRLVPTVIPSVLINMAACQVAIELGAKGPAGAPVGACATGLYAIGDAARRLVRGEADVMIAGSSESIMTPLALGAFWRIQALSTRNDDPEAACRPFDKERDGTVVAEGAAALVLEREEHALKRGATILGEIVGYGVSEDAFHLIAPDPQGDGAARAMLAALADAEMHPSQIGWISAHGTATPLNDLSEGLAIRRVFGTHVDSVPVTGLKSMLGHTLGAAGSISVIANLKALETGVLPPTRNLQTPDPACLLNHVTGSARETPIDTAMSNAFGFGGQNACLIVRRYR